MNVTTKTLLLIIGIAILVLLGLSTFTGGMMGTHMFTSDGAGAASSGWMRGLGMGLGGLMMLLFWGLVIGGIVLLVRQIGGGSSVSPRENPVDVLKRRYAAGEITREQYEQMKQDLKD